MISIVTVALLLQLLLISSGLALLQLVNPGRHIPILPLVPFAWGLGVMLLYLGGSLFVKGEWLLDGWHLAVAFGMVALTAAGGVVWRRAPGGGEATPARIGPDVSVPRPPVRIRWYDALIIALMLAKVGMVTYSVLVNPIIDSDATGMPGYVGLAKKISEGLPVSEVFARANEAWSKVGSFIYPSLLSAWPNMFLERWHDAVTGLPWLFSWIFGAGVAFSVCYRLTRRFTASLACAYLFLSLPLLMNHLVRMGFHETFVRYFLIAAGGAFAVVFSAREKPQAGDGRTWALVTAAAVLGTMMTKKEGIVWGAILIVTWLSWYLHEYRGVSWKKLFSVQAALAAFLILIHRSDFSKEFFENIDDDRLDTMAPHAFDANAFSATLGYLFTDGSFGLWWWAAGLGGIYLLASKKIADNTKALVLFTFVILAAVLYFANFTWNVPFTLNGTNVSRFLLQISGILLLPVYCALLAAWLPQKAEETSVE